MEVRQVSVNGHVFRIEIHPKEHVCFFLDPLLGGKRVAKVRLPPGFPNNVYEDQGFFRLAARTIFAAYRGQVNCLLEGIELLKGSEISEKDIPLFPFIVHSRRAKSE